MMSDLYDFGTISRLLAPTEHSLIVNGTARVVSLTADQQSHALREASKIGMTVSEWLADQDDRHKGIS